MMMRRGKASWTKEEMLDVVMNSPCFALNTSSSETMDDFQDKVHRLSQPHASESAPHPNEIRRSLTSTMNMVLSVVGIGTAAFLVSSQHSLEWRVMFALGSCLLVLVAELYFLLLYSGI